MTRFGQLSSISSSFENLFPGSYCYFDGNESKSPLLEFCSMDHTEEQSNEEEQCDQGDANRFIYDQERKDRSLSAIYEKMEISINFIFKSDVILVPGRNAERETLHRANSIAKLLIYHTSQDIPEAVTISTSIVLALVECILLGAVGQRDNGRHGVMRPDSVSGYELVHRVIQRVNLLCDGKFGGIPGEMKRIDSHKQVLQTITDISKISSDLLDDSGNKCEIQNKIFADELHKQFEIFRKVMNSLINSDASTVNSEQKSEGKGQKRIRHSEDSEESNNEQTDKMKQESQEISIPNIDESVRYDPNVPFLLFKRYCELNRIMNNQLYGSNRTEKARKMFLCTTLFENYGEDNRNKRLGRNVRRMQRLQKKQINKTQESEKEGISQQQQEEESFQSQVDIAVMEQEKEEEQIEQLEFIHLRRDRIAKHFQSNTQTLRDIERIVLGERDSDQSEYLPWWCTIKVGNNVGVKEEQRRDFIEQDREWGSDISADLEQGTINDFESEEDGQYLEKKVKRKR